MKQAVLTMLIVGAFVANSTCAEAESDNPFGFETHTHPLEYEYCQRVEREHEFARDLYECRSAPRMHPDLQNIHLNFVEGVGLCFIRAGSFDNIIFDKKLKDLIDGFKDQIVQKYGPPTSQLKEVDPAYFIGDEEFDLVGEKKAYRYDWEQQAGFRGRGDVAGISVARLSGKAIIVFDLKTSEACRQKMDEHRSRAF